MCIRDRYEITQANHRISECQNEIQGLEKKIERLEEAKQKLQTYKLNIETEKFDITQKISCSSWKGSNKEEYEGIAEEQLKPCYQTYYDETDRAVDAIMDEITRLENQIYDQEMCIRDRVKGGLLPGRKVVLLHFGKTKMKISLMNNAIGSDIQNQKENVEKFCQAVALI